MAVVLAAHNAWIYEMSFLVGAASILGLVQELITFRIIRYILWAYSVAEVGILHAEHFIFLNGIFSSGLVRLIFIATDLILMILSLLPLAAHFFWLLPDPFYEWVQENLVDDSSGRAEIKWTRYCLSPFYYIPYLCSFHMLALSFIRMILNFWLWLFAFIRQLLVFISLRSEHMKQERGRRHNGYSCPFLLIPITNLNLNTKVSAFLIKTKHSTDNLVTVQSMFKEQSIMDSSICQRVVRHELLTALKLACIAISSQLLLKLLVPLCVGDPRISSALLWILIFILLKWGDISDTKIYSERPPSHINLKRFLSNITLFIVAYLASCILAVYLKTKSSPFEIDIDEDGDMPLDGEEYADEKLDLTKVEMIVALQNVSGILVLLSTHYLATLGLICGFRIGLLALQLFFAAIVPCLNEVEKRYEFYNASLKQDAEKID